MNPTPKFSDYVIGLLTAFIDTLPSFKGTPVHQALFKADAEGYTLLHHAVLTNHFQLLQAMLMLLVKAPNGNRIINAQDKSGLSPLHWSVIRRCDQAISLLVEQGRAHLNIQNAEGRTPLSFAVDRFSEVEQQLSRDESKNQFDLQLTRYLLSKGASPHLTDISGTSPLHIVSSFADLIMMKALIEEGAANVNQCDGEGEHALFYAIRSGSLEAVKLLVESYRINLSIENQVKETPLEAAVACADDIICNYLRATIVSKNTEMESAFPQSSRFPNQVEITGLSPLSSEEIRRNSYSSSMDQRLEASASMLPQEGNGSEISLMDKEEFGQFNPSSMSLSAGAHWGKYPAFSAQSAF